MTIVLAGARARISVPAPPIARGGFLSAARVIDLAAGDHALMGAQYLTDACVNETQEWTAPWCVTDIQAQCEEPAAPPANVKVFEENTEVVEGDPFTLYAGNACDIDSLEGRAQAARAAFDYGERRSVDRAMTRWLATLDTAVGESPQSVDCLIGDMDGWLAANYGGVGLIALSIPAATEAIGKGYVVRSGDSLSTALGTPVVAYTRLGFGQPFDAWAMGQLTLLRGPLNTFSVPPMNRADGTCAPARALAERSYVPLVECAVGKFQSTCCDCAAPVTP